MVNDTTRLLGLDGLAVTRVEDGHDGGPVVYLETADARAQACPVCGVDAVRVKEWITTGPRDLPVAGRTVGLRWRKRRWVCDRADCPRGTFTEQVEQVPARARITTRLRAAAGAAVGDGGRTIVQSARDHGLSWPVTAAAFAAHAARVLPEQPDPVAVLGIDETRRGRPRWQYNTELGVWEMTVDRWHVGFVDIGGGQGLLGQVEGRTAQSVIDWINGRSPDWRAAVGHVAIDMCTVFKAAITSALPHATLVVDHFHVVQLANKVIDEVRCRRTAQVRGRRGRSGDREWDLRNKLTANVENRDRDKTRAMVAELADLGEIGPPILAAWLAKEELRHLLALARTHPDRHQISQRLFRFYSICADGGVPEVQRLATTVQTWWPQIEAFLHTGITNATSEGINRIVKLEARTAYGFRNPTNQRLRTRCATTRRARGCLNPA
ncbi:MAG TPA: ISL3 family transposase [Actinophytocola sp.]|jgi:transposase|uniref:ISL3 family transposase n=1 Tax=Actinophytocola sp. TaxID=1872138 RepID=UPI002E0CEB05|nr:ISL3 family transposase [Actinophytocola sp.]